ncbi:uncharacterized protein LOC124942379 [Impatiens glandulifera]|uniref:uncharacterized protein LOC124942379 n=1 Tax=Impatiens glandulifera TaxID=253017 RepID=UPI001FB15243|nr:uncharacterized protein LOC124942379 [Impatiens glandulifera]
MGKGRSKNNISQNVSNVSPVIMEKPLGKKQTNVNAKSMMKLDHIRKLAVWASGEAALPSLNAFFGYRLSALTETLGASQDSSLLQCQRCKSILHPGENCTVRIEKNRGGKTRRHKKPDVSSTQNSVVYTCHFCSHQNRRRGTPKGHMKKICPAKPKLVKKQEPLLPVVELVTNPDSFSEVNNKDNGEIVVGPSTPLVGTKTMTLLESKQRKRNRSGKKKATESDDNSNVVDLGTSRKKKKTWTSLKEIAERSEHDNDINNHKFANLKIPFLL